MAQKRFGYIPVKLTAIETLLSADKNISIDTDFDTNRTDRYISRCISNKTTQEIKSDVEKAIIALRDQYKLRAQAERKAVEFALEKITSRNAGFTHKDLVAAALEYALQDQIAIQNKIVTREDIEKIIREKRASGELVMGKYFDDGTRWTTKEILDLEHSIIANVKQGINKVAPLLNPEKARDLVENNRLTVGQKQACCMICTAKDQYVIVQGYAGVGKTTMFSHIKKMLTEKEVGINEPDITGIKGEGSAYKMDKAQERVQEKAREEVQEEVQEQEQVVEHSNKSSDFKKIEIIGLAPTHKAVKELKHVGINAQTLKSFLIEQSRLAKEKDSSSLVSANLSSTDNSKKSNISNGKLDNKLIILDEVSMVSNEEFAQFTKLTSKSNTHVVFSGDMSQHITPGSGKPYELVLRSNVSKVAYVTEIVRQKNPNLKEAIKNIIQGNYSQAFDKIIQENPQNHIERINQPVISGVYNSSQLINEKTQEMAKENIGENTGKSPDKSLEITDFEFFKNLKKSIVEIDNNNLKDGEKTLEEMLANDYLTRLSKTRDKTVIIVHAHDDRRVINELIRNGLKAQNSIKQKGTQVGCLVAKGLTDSEHKSLYSYTPGDVIRFGGGYYHVVNIDRETKSLLLKDEFGKERYFYPEREVGKYNLELYSHITRELAAGDLVRLTKTDKTRELYANFEYKVKNIDEKNVILESKLDLRDDKQAKNIVLNHQNLKDSHWDYAYTVTGYGIQGGSEKFVIDFEVSYRKHLANQRSFYIGSSRAVEHLIIYTDNKDRTLQGIISNSGDKYAGMEVTGELYRVNSDPANTTNTNNRYLGVDRSTIYKSNHIKQNVLFKFKKPKDINTQHRIKEINTECYSVKDIKQSLVNAAETVVRQLLGDPNTKLSSSAEWRYGNKGSLVVNMAGTKKGVWYNFETGESGDLISLLQKDRGLTFSETLKYASTIFGGDFRSTQDVRNVRNIENIKVSSVIENNSLSKGLSDTKNEKTSKYAKKLAKESLPVVGTIVEKYLKEKRDIEFIETADIRYHPKVYVGKDEINADKISKKKKYLPAMLSIGRDSDGNTQCVQATYLDPKTANKADLDIKKRTYASPSGALVLLGGKERQDRDYNYSNDINKTAVDENFNTKNIDKNHITFIAEGIETGLSIRDATRDIRNSEVVVTLGKSNFSHIDPDSIGNKVVFCLDNDGPKTLVDNTIHKAAECLIGMGKEVFIALPEQPRINNDGSAKEIKIDFNDIAIKGGIAAVKSSLEGAEPYNDWKRGASKNIVEIDLKNREINPSVIKEVMQKIRKGHEIPDDILNTQNVRTDIWSSKSKSIDLNAAVSLIDSSRKHSFEKYYDSYKQLQSDMPIRRYREISKNLNTDDMQKNLSKMEKEIC